MPFRDRHLSLEAARARVAREGHQYISIQECCPGAAASPAVQLPGGIPQRAIVVDIEVLEWLRARTFVRNAEGLFAIALDERRSVGQEVLTAKCRNTRG